MAAEIRRFPPRNEAMHRDVLDRAATTYFSRRLGALPRPERRLLVAMVMFLDEGREGDLIEICQRIEAILQDKKGV
jgi:hypothetical protein